MMTLLLVFDALDAGRLRLNDIVTVTIDGALQAPTRLGLALGKTMSVESAIRAVGDLGERRPVALADKLDGDEVMFVKRMNRRAAQLGMISTRFGNATGLESAQASPRLGTWRCCLAT